MLILCSMKENSSISIRLIAAAISDALIKGLSLAEIRRLYAIINLINQNIFASIALYQEIPTTTPATTTTSGTTITSSTTITSTKNKNKNSTTSGDATTSTKKNDKNENKNN